MVAITTTQVWDELEKRIFGVMGMVNAAAQARTVGVVYVAHDRVLYVGTERDAWKTRHVSANPEVSMTVTIPKFVPFVKVPSATITFSATAAVLEVGDTPPEAVDALFRGTSGHDDSVILALRPTGYFVTYGVGVSTLGMRDTRNARGRAAVA